MSALEDKKQTRDIDGTTYEVTPLPFGIGRKALKRTVDVLAPLVAAAFEGEGKAGIGKVFDALPDALSDADLDFFSETFGNASRYLDTQTGNMVPLVKANQELHFAGEYLRFFKWLTFSLEVNFAGFFAGTAGKLDLAALMAKLKPGQEKSPASPA